MKALKHLNLRTLQPSLFGQVFWVFLKSSFFTLLIFFGIIALIYVVSPEISPDLPFFLDLADLVMHAGLIFFSAKMLEISLFKSGYAFKFWHLALVAVFFLFNWFVLDPAIEFLSLPEFYDQGIYARPALQNNLLRALLICLIGPILEEVLYRGIFQEYLHRQTTPGLAIFYASLLFALVHFSPGISLSAFLAGLLLGYLYYATRSLLAPVCLHVLHNTATVYETTLREWFQNFLFS